MSRSRRRRRRRGRKEDDRIELLVCSDASKYGYGIVCYVRKSLIGKPEGHVSFLFAKAHVVPLNMMRDPLPNAEDHCKSIPRLELCAAKLAAVHRDILTREAGEDFHQIHMLTDSKTVLQWIGDWEKRFAV